VGLMGAASAMVWVRTRAELSELVVEGGGGGSDATYNLQTESL
jgi:hypothetical protein